jgi:hypothetical protein
MLIKKIQSALCSLSCACSFLVAATGEAQNAQHQVIALKINDSIFIRTYFSHEEDILLTVKKGMNGQINFFNAKLIPSSAPTNEASFSAGIVIHKCGDDCTPWNINSTFIGANHGCSNARELTVKKHGLTIADVGSEWADKSENKFYVLKVIEPDTIWILSENKGNTGKWRFIDKVNGNVLKSVSDGKVLAIEDNKMLQIRPACRIMEQAYLVDGKKNLAEGVPTPCEFLDIKETYDIISPASLLDSIRKNTGQEADFVAQNLDSVLSNHIIYRFLPMGACTVEHKAVANKEFRMGYMGFIQASPLFKGKFDSHSYYIPKTLPFENNGIKFDFKAIQDFSIKISVPLFFNEKEKNIETTTSLPDRFIQFLGKKEAAKTINKVAFAIGYSLIEGMTKSDERAKNSTNSLHIYTSSKSYPYAIDSKTGDIPVGKEFYSIAYRQYFDPSAYKNATCVFWHKQADSYVLYIDYHKSVDKDTIKLPAYLSGKKITVIEKSPSVKLLNEGTVPDEGLILSVDESYGYLVVRLD